MTLQEYLKKCEWEVTVHDDVYDVEVYFYHMFPEDVDDWSKAMDVVSSHLEIVSEDGMAYGDPVVTVNLSRTIERNLNNFDELFIHNDVDSIMDDIEAIFAGGVSEEWMTCFANSLKGET